MDNAVKNILRTKNEIYEFEAVWTVENFLMYPALEQGEHVKSAPFSSNKAKGIAEWDMEMYPNGCKTNKVEGFVGLFLKIQQLANDVEGVLASFHLTIIDVNGMKQKTWNAEKHFFRNDGLGWGLPSFVSREELEKPGNDLLPNGHLTVECHIEATFKYKVSECKTSTLNDDSECDFAAKTLGQMLEDSICSDVILKTSGTEFHCHKSVLSARSPYFRAMFSHDMKENRENVVDLSKEMDASELNDLVNFIYKGKATNLYQTCYTLYHVADVYSLCILKNLCEIELIKKISSETALDLLVFAEKNNARKLQKLAAKRMFESS